VCVRPAGTPPRAHRSRRGDRPTRHGGTPGARGPRPPRAPPRPGRPPRVPPRGGHRPGGGSGPPTIIGRLKSQTRETISYEMARMHVPTAIQDPDRPHPPPPPYGPGSGSIRGRTESHQRDLPPAPPAPQRRPTTASVATGLRGGPATRPTDRPFSRGGVAPVPQLPPLQTCIRMCAHLRGMCRTLTEIRRQPQPSGRRASCRP